MDKLIPLVPELRGRLSNFLEIDRRPPLELVIYGTCVAFCLYMITTSIWNIVDILGSKLAVNWRKTPATTPFGLPVLGHALYFAINMPLFSYLLK